MGRIFSNQTISGYDYHNQTNLAPLKNRESADFFMMCFEKANCDIFYPHSTFAEGRNSALRLVLALDPGERERDQRDYIRKS